MLRKRSEFPARNEDNLRKRFVTVWTVIVFGAALTLVLFGFFPERYLVDAAIRTDDIDSVKVAYLTSLLEKDPGNAEFRIELARQLKHFGEDLRALDILEPVADHRDPRVARRARTMQFEILEKLAYRHPPESRERKEYLARMRRILFRLAAMTQDSASLAFLAAKAEAVGAYSLAVAASDRLSHQSPDQEAGFYAKAARFSLFERDYRKASHYRFQAMLRAKTASERLDHYRAAIWILQSGRLHREALDSGAFYQRSVGGGDEVLLFLARLGQAGNDPAYSQRWLLRLLRLHETLPAGAQQLSAMRPYDEGIYRLAFEIFLGTGNLEWARLIAERSVEANPRSAAWRMELARLAEWTNRPQVAEEQWLNAARLTGSLEMYRNVLRIALQLHDVPYIIEGYKGVLLSAPLDSAEWALMVRSYEEAGAPQMVIPVLETELRRRPHYKRFLTLAALYEHLGEDSLAIVALDRAAREFGTNPALALHQARLLLNQADLVGSYRAAAAAMRSAGPDDSDYWIHVGDLAWTLQQDSVALASYRMLVESGRYTDSDLLRLVLLARKSDPARAHDYAALGWKRFRIPTFFLQMVDLSVSAGKWKQARAELASITEEELPLVAWLPAFWIYRAQAAHQDGRGAEALDDYRQALVLDPGSRDLRANCLWLLVELGRTGEVREAVARWLPAEPGDPVLTPAFAAAFVHLGDRRNALRWLGSMYGGRRKDPHWLLYYADILAGAGYVEVAGRVRSEAWTVLARDSVPKGADPAEWRAARVRMALEIGSPEQGALAMRSIIEHDSGRSREEVDMALSWFLSRGVIEPVKQFVARKREAAAPVPVWVEMALAMSDGNRPAVAALLRDRKDDLGAEDAVAAADFLRETRRARRWAFEGLERRPENDPLARRFQDLSARGSDRARLEVSSTSSGALAFRDYSMEGRAQARPGLAFRAEYRVREISRQDTAQGIVAPGRAHSALLQAIWESDYGNVRLGIHGRRAEADATGISAEYLTPSWNDLVGRILVGTSESPDESWLLESAALRDRLGLEAAWTPTTRDVLIGQATWNRIRGGRDEALFQGSRWSLAAEHRFRIGYPSLSSFLGATWQRYATAASVPAAARSLIPSRNLSFDAGLAAGELDENTWVRAFRPWFRTGVTSSGSALSNSAFSGWYAQGGMQGSLVGGDRTSVYLVLAKESFTGRSFDRRIGFQFSYYLR